MMRADPAPLLLPPQSLSPPSSLASSPSSPSSPSSSSSSSSSPSGPSGPKSSHHQHNHHHHHHQNPDRPSTPPPKYQPQQQQQQHQQQQQPTPPTPQPNPTTTTPAAAPYATVNYIRMPLHPSTSRPDPRMLGPAVHIVSATTGRPVLGPLQPGGEYRLALSWLVAPPADWAARKALEMERRAWERTHRCAGLVLMDAGGVLLPEGVDGGGGGAGVGLSRAANGSGKKKS